MKTYVIYFNKSSMNIRLKADHVVISVSENYGGLCVGQQYTFLDDEQRVVGIFPLEEVFFIVDDACVLRNKDQGIVKFDSVKKCQDFLKGDSK